MEPKEWRSSLRDAVYRADGRSLVGLLRHGLPEDALQLAGDGLVAALENGVDGAAGLADRCAAALRDRDWEGDATLADGLEARLGLGRTTTPILRPLQVDLDELSGTLEGDPVFSGGRLDLRTGEVWPQPAIEYAQEIGEDIDDDSERWLPVWSEGSRDGYRDMELFIAGLDDSDRADRLSIAIEGRGAFRRFKDVLGRWPEELERWYAFSEERQRGRARAWLADAGYRVAPPTLRR